MRFGLRASRKRTCDRSTIKEGRVICGGGWRTRLRPTQSAFGFFGVPFHFSNLFPFPSTPFLSARHLSSRDGWMSSSKERRTNEIGSMERACFPFFLPNDSYHPRFSISNFEKHFLSFRTYISKRDRPILFRSVNNFRGYPIVDEGSQSADARDKKGKKPSERSWKECPCSVKSRHHGRAVSFIRQ